MFSDKPKQAVEKEVCCVVEMESEAEKIEERKGEARKVVAEEKKKATEMRARALESLSQTRKRHQETEKDEGKKETKR